MSCSFVADKFLSQFYPHGTLGGVCLEGWHLLFLSLSLITLKDVAPIIGVAILVLILIALFVIIIEWYRYMVKKGVEQYEREHGFGRFTTWMQH